MMKNALVVGVVALLAGSAQAWEIRMDISNVVSTTGGNWNNIGFLNGVNTDLIEFGSGANTGASISGFGWQDFFGDDNGEFANVDWVQQPATADGAGVSTGGSASFTISGLADGLYIVEVVSARTDFEYLNFIAVGGEIADRTFNGTAVNFPWNSTTDGLAESNWLIWDDVQTDDGEININLTSDADTLGMINAIRISQIPGPGAAALLGLAGVAGLRRRR
jgi:uncharacterized protein (TIGR03382 family)